jgi:hypothetical protein
MAKIFFFFTFIVILVVSCSKEDAVFEIGSDRVDVKGKVEMIDTFTLKTYTVVLDSLATSYHENSVPDILVGSFHEPEIGTVYASGYFRIGVASTEKYNIQEDAVFDSVRFYLVQSGYCSNDTAKHLPFTLSVHRLTGVLWPNTDGYFYNNDSVSAISEPLGSVTYRPRINSKDTLWIRLDTILGNEIFTLMKSNAEKVMNNERFAEYFKGVLIQYGSNDSVILGFKYPETNGSAGRPAMRIYYHYYTDTRIKKISDFKALPVDEITRNSVQFNRIVFRNKVVPLPDRQEEKLSSTETGNKTFIIGGCGISTRIEVPYLRNLLLLGENVQILKAELILEPVMNSYYDIFLPKSLNLVITNDQNHWGSYVTNSSGYAQNGDLVIDELYQEETRYTFDITNFLISKLYETTEDVPALLVAPAGRNLYATIDRLLLGNQQNSRNNVKLKVYYMNVE